MSELESVMPKRLFSDPFLELGQQRELFETIRDGLDLELLKQEQKRRFEAGERWSIIYVAPEIASDEAIQAHSVICRSYVNWVKYIGLRTGPVLRRLGSSFDDGLQDGYIGLSESVWGYDPNNGASFMAYSAHSIRSAVYRGRAKIETPFKIPAWYYEAVKNFKIDTYHRNVDDTVDDFLQANPQMDRPGARVVYHRLNSVVSLDEITKPENIDLVDQDDDEHFVTVDNALAVTDEAQYGHIEDSAQIKSDLAVAINKLPLRDREIFVQRFGLEDNEPKTLVELGRIYGLTKSRIQQIEVNAIASIRSQIVREKV